MIKLENVNKSYRSGEDTLHVLKDISLEINTSEMVAIMGPSGSGKSTLINLIGFIDKKFEGNYLFEGKACSDYNDKKLSMIRNEKVGFVFQNFSLIENNTVLENIELPLLYAGYKIRDTKKKVLDILKKVELEEKIDKYPKQLSGGQQQRIAIARAMVNNPQFIIADEPTGALDSKTSLDIIKLFRELNEKEGITIIIVTHDLEMAKYCDRTISIYDGEILGNEGIVK